MEEDIFYDNIQKALENLPDNFSILEEQIDMEVQWQYFEFSGKMRTPELSEECFENREQLFDPATGDGRKKEILSGIAIIDDVAAYRTIEKFMKTAGGELKSWATLAFQESRMLLQSSLLDEQQVFISTGLGGKGHKLRYFTVFINQQQQELLTSTQRKLLKDELIFELDKCDGEVEVVDFMEGFSTAQVMLPLKTDIKQIFRNIIDECNQYGHFLNDDFMVTNVKVLTRGEIIQFLEKNRKQADDELEEE
jgi:hypothetical protein